MKQYDRVKVINNKYQNEGVAEGDIGYIIEIHDEDNLEVEFSDNNGKTLTMVVMHKCDLTLD